MESTRLSKAFFFLITFSTFQVTFSQKFIKFKRNTAFENYVCDAADVDFEKTGGVSIVGCNVLCEMSNTCSGIFYGPASMRCVGCKKKMSCSNRGVNGAMGDSLHYEKSGMGYCVREPCLNGGTCSDTAVGYTCSCISGYSGTNFEDGGIIEYYDYTTKSFQDGREFLESNNVRPFNHFLFSVKTSRDVFILLQSDRNDYTSYTGSNYFIIIGGWGGQKSEITRGNDVKSINTYNIFSLSEYRWFWVSWKETTATVGKSDKVGTNVMLSLSGTPFDVIAVEIGTGQSTTVYWRIPKAMNECDVNPCLNGGTCKDDINNRTCICPGGYEGPTCAERCV